MKIIYLIFVLFVAMAVQVYADEAFFGFHINSKAINPVCISKMSPLISDNGQIIVKSIVLEECQKSRNWAFHAKPIAINENSVSTEIEGQPFIYQVIGKTENGLFIILLDNNWIVPTLVAYRIDEQKIKPDLLNPEVEKVHIMTAVAESSVLCFKDAKVKNNKLIIKRSIPNPDPQASRMERCTADLETLEYNLAD